MKSLSRSPSLYGSVLALAALSSTPALAQSEGTKCQSLTDCDAGLTCVYGNVSSSSPGTSGGMAEGSGSTPVTSAPAGSGVSAAPVAPLPPESTGGASSTGEDPTEPPVDGLVAPPPPDDGKDPVITEEVGVCTALPDPCTSDEQCDEGYYCSITDVATPPAPSITCPPDSDCVAVPVNDAAIAPTSGTCVISPLTCSDSEPCPEATTCSDGYCTYQPTECMSDDACDAGYSCTVTSSYQECTGCTGSAGSGMTAPGMTAPAGATIGAAGSGSSTLAPPEDGADRIAVPPEEGGGSTPTPCTTVCTPVEERTCQPTPDACETDADCDGDWVCYEVPAAALATMTWAGIEKTCLPLGIVASLEGSVQGPYSATLTGEATAVAGGTPGPMVPGTPVDQNGNAAGAPVPMNTAGQAGSAATATGTVSGPSGAPPSGSTPGDATTTTGVTPVRAARGCAVVATTTPKDSSTGASLLAALALAVGMLRRRRVD